MPETVKVKSLKTGDVRELDEDTANKYVARGGYEIVKDDGSYIGELVSNIPQSGARMVGDIARVITHPVETAKSLVSLGRGIYEAVLPGSQGYEQDEQGLRSLGKFFADRYGSVDAAKETLKNDPIGFAADASALLSGGGSLAARAPGIAGRVAAKTAGVGRAIDPVAMAAKGAAATGRTAGRVGSTLLDVATGAGSEPFMQAARTGYRGGAGGAAFRSQMRGTAPIDDVLNDVRGAVENMRQDRASKYTSGMVDIKGDKTILDMQPLIDEIGELEKAGTFGGKTIEKSAVKVRGDIVDAVLDWASSDPAKFHTPEGLDALKRKIWDIADANSVAPHSNADRVVKSAYNAVKKQIESQAPQYADVMKEYHKASELLDELQRTYNIERSLPDTSLRKLQSIMRNNAYTNYGRRLQLADTLVEAGADRLLPSLAGQALSSAAPRGIQKSMAQLAGLAGGAGVVAGSVAPSSLLSLAATSPRLMGELVHGSARAAGLVGRPIQRGISLLGKTGPQTLEQIAFQAGRASNLGANQ